jgi:hypothetical protein
VQLKITLTILFSFFSVNSFAYTCNATEYKKPISKIKKEAFSVLRVVPRQTLVEGLLYELTVPELSKANIERSSMLLNYLENSEVDSNQRAFFKLLSSASELESQHPKSLKQKEVCEIMNKVNDLK